MFDEKTELESTNARTHAHTHTHRDVPAHTPDWQYFRFQCGLTIALTDDRFYLCVDLKIDSSEGVIG